MEKPPCCSPGRAVPPRVEHRPLQNQLHRGQWTYHRSSCCWGCANTHGRRNRSDVPRGRALPPRAEHQHSAATAASHHDSTGRASPPRGVPSVHTTDGVVAGRCTYTNRRRCSGVKLGPTRFSILVTAQRPKNKRRGEEAVCLLPVSGSTSRDNGECGNQIFG